LCSYTAKGQDTITSYFDHKWKKIRNKELAVYYRKVYPGSSGMWIVKSYYMNGQLQMEGQYSDKRFKIKQGAFIFYHNNGNISSLGQYSNDKKVGIWKRYYRSGGLHSEGKITNNKHDSIWTYYHINGSIFGKGNHINGKKEGRSTWFYESGKISEIAVYKKNKITSKIHYDEDGNVIKVEKDHGPEFIGGNDRMILFLRENLKYPEELLSQRRKAGVIVFYFTVRKDGSIDNIEYINSDEPLFDQEALRVFSLIKQMKPARYRGQILDQECILPITFIQ